jgi:co-chaperonin GroES (HSP10)
MTPNQIEAVRDILFIRREIEDDKFGDSPIIRPETFKMEMSVAEVISVGPDIADRYAPGDLIYVGKLAGLKMTELGTGYFLVNHNEVLAKVNIQFVPQRMNGEALDASGSVEVKVGGLLAVTPEDLKKL